MWSLSLLPLVRCHSTALLLPLHQRTQTNLSSRFHRSFHKISATTTKTAEAQQQPNMEGKGGDSSPINSSPNVERMRVLLSSDSKDGWDKCWEEGLTPWDLGGPTPIILHLLQTESLPKGRVLVPGCGSGHDVIAIASPERYVVGLDLSNSAINNAKELSMSLSNANYLEFVKADFFNWNPTKLFDLFFDYTFFCAIEPCLRSSWASRVGELLKPDGELITLMFPISDHLGGPPFKVSVSDYEEVLHPLGFKAISVVDNDLAIGPRKLYPSMSVAVSASMHSLTTTHQLILQHQSGHDLNEQAQEVHHVRPPSNGKRETWKVEEIPNKQSSYSIVNEEDE